MTGTLVRAPEVAAAAADQDRCQGCGGAGAGGDRCQECYRQQDAADPRYGEPCAVRFSRSWEGPYTACTRPAGHDGYHVTETKRGDR